jgi:hypothetical protein
MRMVTLSHLEKWRIVLQVFLCETIRKKLQWNGRGLGQVDGSDPVERQGPTCPD